MKSITALLALSLGVLLGIARAETEAIPEAVVSKAGIPVPASSKGLWKQFSTKERQSGLSALKLAEWQTLREKFTAALLTKAKAAGLEADILAKILARIDAERATLAIVPVEAHRAMQGDRQVWLVLCRWELAGPKMPANTRLGHESAFVYDIATLERVGFETCL